ncbi:hypothetical protein [Klebsiella pneumoniae]|nr:hypothetical protein [Klebsiella pneumoniae]
MTCGTGKLSHSTAKISAVCWLNKSRFLDMQNSISSEDKWVKRWSKHITCLAQNNDLSSREVDSYTAKLVEQASSEELGKVIKDLLNHIRMQK